MRTAYASLIVGIVVGGSAIGCGGPSNPGSGGPPDMATGHPSPPPTFVAGNFKRFPGSTTDGWSIVTDAADTGWAIKLADGTQTKIADHVANVSIYGSVVFVQHDLGADGQGPLSLWKSGGPAQRLADSSPPNSFAFSYPVADVDGHIAYYRNATGGSELVVDTTDHAAPHVVVTGVELTAASSACWPYLQFVAGRLLVSHCDAGATTHTLTSYDPATGGGVDLQTDATATFSARKTVGVLARSTAGALSLVAADGSGTRRLLADDIKSARFDSSGSAVLAVTNAGALQRIPLGAGATATTLVAAGVVRLESVSPDDKLVTFAKAKDPSTFAEDLWLTDAMAAGTPIALVTTTTSSSAGFGFTADSRFALYVAGVDRLAGAGSLRAFPTAGGVERTLAAASDIATPLSGSRIVFSSNRAGTWPDITGDVGYVDLAKTDAPTKLATNAAGFYEVEADDTTVIWLDPGVGLHIISSP